ncbi:acyltransferase [Synechococcus sp. BSF8S]|uniref:acyltransferase family protein n=1 Tax=Synechococcales TaxID=1890424 RepID=UPI00210400FA|nr:MULTISPECIES: acyltransferase [unclassified Synechococcus]MBC1262468.1 acyltransferase [Synechococcus sp. BSF8S]MBC1265351.1 acyltransferase [Synechococcus sp. BSA11S]
MTKDSTGRRYWPVTDGLRGMSVLAIILHHFNTILLPGGYLDVDIFFVISGFVITSSLAEQSANKGLGELLLRFYARRVRRLLPALVVCVLIPILLACLFDPMAGRRVAPYRGSPPCWGFPITICFPSPPTPSPLTPG